MYSLWSTRSMRNLSLIECLKGLPAPIDLVLSFILDRRFISYSGYFDSTSLQMESNSDNSNPVNDLNNNGFLDNLS